MRAGSTSSSRPGALGPLSPISAPLQLGQLGRPPAHPRGDGAQRLVGRELQTGALDVGIGVLNLDLVGAGLVTRRRHGSRQLLLAQLGVDQHDLTRRHVGAEPHSQVRQCLHALGDGCEAIAVALCTGPSATTRSMPRWQCPVA